MKVSIGTYVYNARGLTPTLLPLRPAVATQATRSRELSYASSASHRESDHQLHRPGASGTSSALALATVVVTAPRHPEQVRVHRVAIS